MVAAAIVAGVFLTREREPRYQGHTLGYWVEILGNEGTTNVTPAQVAQATQAVRQIGTKAIPFLLKWINYAPPPWKIRLYDMIHQMPESFGLLARMIPYEEVDIDRAVRAIRGFEILGKQGAPAIPELTIMLDRTNSLDSLGAAIAALASFGSDGLPPLLRVMEDPSHPQRYTVGLALVVKLQFENLWQDTNASLAIPVLVRCTKDNDPGVATMAIQALASLQNEPEIVIPALTNAFRSTNEDVRYRAVCCMQINYKDKASLAAPALRNMLNDSDFRVRWEASNMLARIESAPLTNAPPQ